MKFISKRQRVKKFFLSRDFPLRVVLGLCNIKIFVMAISHCKTMYVI